MEKVKTKEDYNAERSVLTDIESVNTTVENGLKTDASPKSALQEPCAIDASNEFPSTTAGNCSNDLIVQDNTSAESPDNSKNNVSFNPNRPEDEETEILERLRGDAIGNTLYSERFVISTLLKLREIEEPLENDESFERDLEGLWDMTIEKDVVLKLIELDVYEIFSQSIVKYEKDNRLIEILVGIIGNMCTVSDKALEQLCKNESTTAILLQLISCEDSGVLIQLMRLITMVYNNEEAARMWNRQIMVYPEFVVHFCFILKNSNNQTLLGHALEALNAALAKCATIEEPNHDDIASENVEKDAPLLQIIVGSNLATSTIEAFQTLYSKEINESTTSHEPDEFVESDCIPESLKKSFIVFLNIHDIVLNYGSQVYNEDSELALTTCFNIILKAISTPNFILPANIEYTQDVLECMLPIYLTSNKLQNEETVFCLINLWRILKNFVDVSADASKATKSFEADDLELNEGFEELYDLTNELLKMLLKNYKGNSLVHILRRCEAENALQVFKFYGVKINDYNTDHIDAYCTQLEAILHGHKQET